MSVNISHAWFLNYGLSGNAELRRQLVLTIEAIGKLKTQIDAAATACEYAQLAAWATRITALQEKKLQLERAVEAAEAEANAEREKQAADSGNPENCIAIAVMHEFPIAYGVCAQRQKQSAKSKLQ